MRRSAPSSHRYGYLARTHTHAHTSYILAGPVPSACVCVIVHVSEVGQQQQRYLTHPEKTSGQFKQPSHWLQLPVYAHKTINNTHAAIRSCCIRTSAGMHTHIHTYTSRSNSGCTRAEIPTYTPYTQTVQWVFTTLSQVQNVYFLQVSNDSVLYCTQYLTLLY